MAQLDKKYDSTPILLTFGSSIDSNVAIEIYDVISNYKDLESIYNNWNTNYYDTFYITIIEDILHKKYNEERFNSMHIIEIDNEFHQVGTCKNCNKWKHDNVTEPYYTLNSGVNYAIKIRNLNYVPYNQCQACGILWNDCKYNYLTVDYNNLLIYNNKKEVIAKFRVIRQNPIDFICNNLMKL